MGFQDKAAAVALVAYWLNDRADDDDEAHADLADRIASLLEARPAVRAAPGSKPKRGRTPRAEAVTAPPKSEPVASSDSKTCTAPCEPPCERPVEGRGLCKAHYQRQQRGKSLTAPLMGPRGRGRKGLCSAPCHPPCTKPGSTKSKGFCGAHYSRQRLGKPVDVQTRTNLAPQKDRTDEIDAVCAMPDCDAEAYRTDQLCRRHRLEWRRAIAENERAAFLKRFNGSPVPPALLTTEAA